MRDVHIHETLDHYKLVEDLHDSVSRTTVGELSFWNGNITVASLSHASFSFWW